LASRALQHSAETSKSAIGKCVKSLRPTGLIFTPRHCVARPPIGAVFVATKDDLLTTSIGQTWGDWWNHKPADNTFCTGILDSVSTTALGLAVSLLILASASLVATVLVRMAHVVDRARVLAAIAHEA
jgi:hypothetical protein